MALEYRQPKLLYSIAQKVVYNTASIGSGIQIGTIPVGAIPCGVLIDVGVAFDNASYMNIGFSATGFEFAFDQSLITTGKRESVRYVEVVTPIPITAEREVWVKIVNSPTVGSSVVRVDYVY